MILFYLRESPRVSACALLAVCLCFGYADSAIDSTESPSQGDESAADERKGAPDGPSSMQPESRSQSEEDRPGRGKPWWPSHLPPPPPPPGATKIVSRQELLDFGFIPCEHPLGERWDREERIRKHLPVRVTYRVEKVRLGELAALLGFEIGDIISVPGSSAKYPGKVALIRRGECRIAYLPGEQYGAQGALVNAYVCRYEPFVPAPPRPTEPASDDLFGEESQLPKRSAPVDLSQETLAKWRFSMIRNKRLRFERTMTRRELTEMLRLPFHQFLSAAIPRHELGEPGLMAVIVRPVEGGRWIVHVRQAPPPSYNDREIPVGPDAMAAFYREENRENSLYIVNLYPERSTVTPRGKPLMMPSRELTLDVPISKAVLLDHGFRAADAKHRVYEKTLAAGEFRETFGMSVETMSPTPGARIGQPANLSELVVSRGGALWHILARQAPPTAYPEGAPIENPEGRRAFYRRPVTDDTLYEVKIIRR